MISHYTLALVFSLSTFLVSAQVAKQEIKSSKGCSCRFQTVLEGGLLEGSSGTSWSIQTINGIYYKTWFAGIGIGLDYYLKRSIPLFMSVSKDLLRNKRTPFLYVNSGVNFDWLRDSEKTVWESSDYRHGFYYDIRAGYKLQFGKRDALLVSVGYTTKTLYEDRLVQQCPFISCHLEKDRYRYAFKRFGFKIGWQL